jgi:hypothetical protein
MISLCLRCHAKVGRTKCVLSEMPPLLLQLWREQHPDGQEQVMIDFTVRELPAEPVALFPEEKRARDSDSYSLPAIRRNRFRSAWQRAHAGRNR